MCSHVHYDLIKGISLVSLQSLTFEYFDFMHSWLESEYFTEN